MNHKEVKDAINGWSKDHENHGADDEDPFEKFSSKDPQIDRLSISSDDIDDRLLSSSSSDSDEVDDDVKVIEVKKASTTNGVNRTLPSTRSERKKRLYDSISKNIIHHRDEWVAVEKKARKELSSKEDQELISNGLDEFRSGMQTPEEYVKHILEENIALERDLMNFREEGKSTYWKRIADSYLHRINYLEEELKDVKKNGKPSTSNA